MKQFFLLNCVLLIVQLGQAVSQTITCESIRTLNWYGSIDNVKTCFMTITTTIDTDAVSVSSPPPDSKVLGLHFTDNNKISFLPIKLDETYPNLEGYGASNCSLKTVSKINFKNLKELTMLYLDNNQIEIINRDTFEDLTSLEKLNLDHNKIKQMNAAVFRRLNRLYYVNLSENICISRIYFDGTQIAKSLVKRVNEGCAFAEPEENRELLNEGSTMSSDLHVITCESFQKKYWSGSIQKVRRCNMESTTTIDTDAVSVSPPDSLVLGLSFNNNKKIAFLPIGLDETYPNLVVYDAAYCSLKSVSKINFRNLKGLRELSLSHNQIETIDSDTFEDLTSLEYLWLGHNKIKEMNAAVFGKLNKLGSVGLFGNICIDKHYGGVYATAIANLVKDVNKKCAFIESESSLSPTDETTNRIESTTEENRELLTEGSTMSSDLLRVFKSNETLK